MSLVTVYVYFTGWVYAYFYYKDFGITLFSFDVPFGYFLMYAFEPLRTVSGVITVAIFVVLSALYAKGLVWRWALIVALVGCFPALFATAISAAHSVSRQTRSHPRGTIVLAFKIADYEKAIPEFQKANSQKSLHLLLETKDRVTVYYQPESISGQLTAVKVFSVSRADLGATMTISD